MPSFRRQESHAFLLSLSASILRQGDPWTLFRDEKKEAKISHLKILCGYKGVNPSVDCFRRPASSQPNLQSSETKIFGLKGI